MDPSDQDKVEPENGTDFSMNYHQTTGSVTCNWQINASNIVNPSVDFVPIDSQMSICRGDFVGSASCSSSAPMIDSFGTALWDHPATSQNFGLSEISIPNDAAHLTSTGIGRVGLPSLRMVDMVRNQPSSMLREGTFLPDAPRMLPQSLSHFPTDSGFIERATQYSCFNAGNINDPINSFGTSDMSGFYIRGGGVMQEPQIVSGISGLNTVSGGQGQKNVDRGEGSISAPLSVGHIVADGTPLKSERKIESIVRSVEEQNTCVLGSSNESDEDLEGTGGGLSVKSPGSNKRKRIEQNPNLGEASAQQQSCEAAKDNPETQHKEDQKPALTSNKTSGRQVKHGSKTSDPPKEEYIHVRARRGQATNSHSLAERVRREKISERMKFLQDLVPGCSKVTGKAVMLDEIINYVQSLQRQVEFLSMKLATVNPRMDFNLESLLAKDILQSRAVSSTLGYPQEVPMAYPLHTSQSVPQAPFLGMESHSDMLWRTINSQSTPMPGGQKEPTQLPND